MGGKTFKTTAIVLKKTKMGERDLVVTLLDESGSLVRAVAKGARRPGGSLAAKIELFSTLDALVAQGKTLGVLSEVRLVTDGIAHEVSLEQAACASPVAELLRIVAQEGLPQARLFDMARASFDQIRVSSAPVSLALCAASLWKIMAQEGFRPQFGACVACGAPIESLISSINSGNVAFSFADGGPFCDSCPHPSDTALVESGVIQWCSYLLSARFRELAKRGLDTDALLSCLQLVRQWIRVHAGRDLKSLDFVFTSGIF